MHWSLETRGNRKCSDFHFKTQLLAPFSSCVVIMVNCIRPLFSTPVAYSMDLLQLTKICAFLRKGASSTPTSRRPKMSSGVPCDGTSYLADHGLAVVIDGGETDPTDLICRLNPVKWSLCVYSLQWLLKFSYNLIETVILISAVSSWVRKFAN